MRTSILKSFFIVGVLTLFISCGRNQSQGVPDNAINPDVMKNPATASPQEEKKTTLPVIQFEKDTHDFGTITEGEKISYAFRFKNVGDGDLVIRSANGSCGCTVPEWPKDPVPPGGEGTINVTFDSKGKTGMQNKSITIISNTMPNTKTVNITGEVLKAETNN